MLTVDENIQCVYERVSGKVTYMLTFFFLALKVAFTTHPQQLLENNILSKLKKSRSHFAFHQKNLTSTT